MRWISMLVVLFSFGCEPPLDQPVEPVWGKQACDHCMMLVSERRTAAQVVLVGGQRKFFDDPGCLVEWLSVTGHVPMGTWVRAVDDKGWIDAYATHFAGGHRTPMDFGYLSSARGISFEELQTVVREQRRQRSRAHP
jgi:copper chaperone NosL